MRTVVFVESNTSGTGAILCQRARERGFRPLLLARQPGLYPFAVALGIEIEEIDTSDEARLLERIGSMRGEIAAVTTSSEYFVAAAARLAHALDLPAPPVEAVETCRDKGRLAAFLASVGVGVPASRVVRAVGEVRGAIGALGLPVVVKPVSGSGSVSVRRADSCEQAEALVDELLAVRFNERGMPNPGEVLLQELIIGREYSVEAMGTHIVGVTSKHLGGPSGTFVEIGHDHPALGPAEEIAAVAELVERALDALGFRVGATHAELRVGPSGPAILEINPRLAGGFIPEIVRRARGIDLLGAVLSSALGQPLDLAPTSREHASIRFLLPGVEGVLDGFEGVEEARALGGVAEVATYRDPGTALAIRGDFRDRVGHVIAVARDGETAAAAADRGAVLVRARLRAADTGRIRAEIPKAAREILFGASVDAQLPHLADQLPVDRAHLVMLVEAGALSRERAVRILEEIERLEGSGFAALRGKTAPRGLYLLYEQHLIEQTGPDAGGMLQLGRSRNDLQATVALLRLRRSLGGVGRAALALIGQLAAVARRYERLLMPAYTHGQPAVPITLGHYLAGVAAALSRDAEGWLDASGSLARCPLGAGAVGGTTVPIRPERTAELLGFEGPLVNSVDGVASRDAALRLLAAAAITGTTASRLATDLLAWLGDGGFLSLPDSLVGSSSMMPQKRNPYFLEHVQGRASRPLGAFVSACAAVQSKPFTNHIAVGTEAMVGVEQALEDHRGALVLLELVVGGLVPRAERMAERAAGAYVQATEIATALARDEQLGFRGAHALVGRAVTRAIETGRPLEALVDEELSALGRPGLQGAFGPEDIAARCEHVGGPGVHALDAALSSIEARLPALGRRLDAMEARWVAARAALAEAERSLRAGGER